MTTVSAVSNDAGVLGSLSGAEFAAEVGKILSDTRRRRSLKLRHLADARLSATTLKAAERGELHLTRPMLMQLASRYGVDLGEMFPQRQGLKITADAVSIDGMTEACNVGGLNSMLGAYLRLVDRVRSANGAKTGALRRDDICELADHLDFPRTTIISRLADLMETRGAETRAMLDLYLTGASVVGLKTPEAAGPVGPLGA